MDDFRNSSKKLITENILINLIGNAIPMAFAVLTIPFVVLNLGVEKFGILSIAWLFLGYFSILDLGIGRATTKFVVEYHNKGLQAEIKPLIVTSIFSLFCFGCFIGALLSFFAQFIVESALNVPVYLKQDTIGAIHIISLSIPFVIGVAAARGVLEAQRKFKLLNAIKVPSSILNYVIPGIVVLFSTDIVFIIILLGIARMLLFIVHAYFCFKPFDDRPLISIRLSIVRKLLGYGGWLTISNIVGPVMVYFDRFIIGSILTLALLSYYSTPYEVVTKLLVIAASMTGVLFPVFTDLYLRNIEKLEDVYNKSLKGIFLLLFPVTLFIACFSFEILGFWLGQEFASQSHLVLLLLSFGVLLNSISAIPYTALQAANRPDVPAKIHLMELPFYLAGLFILAKCFGISGVALAWAMRNFVDAIIFMSIYHNAFGSRLGPKSKRFAVVAIMTVCYFAICFLISGNVNLSFKILTYLVMFFSFVFVFWSITLNQQERVLLVGLIKKRYA
jgi:O-antigen/teichoic acid export membrane protein